MDEERARAIIPVWAATEESQKRTSNREGVKQQMTERWREFTGNFIRDHFITIIIIFAVLLEGFIVSAYTKKRVRSEVTEATRAAVEAEMRQGFLDYQNNPNAETEALLTLKRAGFEDFLNWQMGQNLKTGDESLNAAIEALVPKIADHIAGLRMDRGVTIDGCRTYVWGVDFSRLDSRKYGSNIDDVLEGNIEGYTKNRGARPEDTELARELCTDYVKKAYPSKWSPDLEFAEINADGSVTARNEYKTGSKTKFWRYGE